VATLRTSAAGGDTTGTSDRTCTITPAVGDLFVVFHSNSVNNNIVPTCSDDNGGTYTRIRNGLFNTSGSSGGVFVRDQLLTNTTSTTVTVATGSNDSGNVVVLAVAGMTLLGAAAVRQSGRVVNQAAGTTPAVAFGGATLATSFVCGAVANGSNPAGMTSPVPVPERQDVGQATPNIGLEVCSVNSGIAISTMTWASTSATAFAAFAVELDAQALVTPGTINLTLTRFAPVVSAPALVVPGVHALTLTRFAPVVTVAALAVPDTRHLVLTRFAPVVLISGEVPTLYVLENAHTRAIFATDDTFGVVLRSIENLDDRSIMRFQPAPLFSVILRAVGITDVFPNTSLGTAASFVIDGLGHDENQFHLGSSIEDPPLGGRKWFQITVVFEDIGGSSDDIRVYFTAQLLDDQPDRVRFACYLDPAFQDRLTLGAFFWCGPIQLAITPFASEHYLIPVNGGTVTRAPQTDLVGNGTTYRFNTAMGFEPETKPNVASDAMEVFYPEKCSVGLSAYGDRGPGGATVYIHDDLHFWGRRIQDTFSGGLILMAHQQLMENGITAGNGWSVTEPCDLRAAVSYVRVFRRIGPFLGEDVGLDYKKWVESSAEGKANLPLPVREREDMATLRDLPLYVTAWGQEDSGGPGISEEILEELRTAFQKLSGMLAWISSGQTEMFGANQEFGNAYGSNQSTGTHGGNIGDALPDLWDTKLDPGQITKSVSLRNAGALRGGFLSIRRPTPFDGQGIFESDVFSDMRVKDHTEAVKISYRSVNRWLRFPQPGDVITVANVAFDGTFTRITLSIGGADPTLWNMVTTYSLSTGGIDHSGHPQHLGWLEKDDSSWQFVIERQSQADFLATPTILYVAGDQRTKVQVGHSIVARFMALQFLPGLDAGVTDQVGDNGQTSLCSMADDIGADIFHPSVGWAVRLSGALATDYHPWGLVVANKFANFNAVSWCGHGGETPGGNDQILGYRRILAYLRMTTSLPFQWLEMHGPFDWMVGFIDGYTKTNVRLDLTTSKGSWGMTSFFQAVYGAYSRSGAFVNQGAGHASNMGNSVGAYAALWEGATKPQFAEALVSDWILGKVPTLAEAPSAPERMGTRPDGQPAFTPFFHSTFGMTVSTSFAAMLARLIQFHLSFDGVQVDGKRLRSFNRLGGATISSFLQTVSGLDGHNIPATELGNARAPLFHGVWLDNRNAPKIVAVFVNDQNSTVSETYSFDPALYQDLFPLRWSEYTAEQFDVSNAGAAVMTLGLVAGTFSVTLGPGEVVALVITPVDPGNPSGGACDVAGIPPPATNFPPSAGLSGSASNPAGSSCKIRGF
jgi:hypothetical protein